MTTRDILWFDLDQMAWLDQWPCYNMRLGQVMEIVT